MSENLKEQIRFHLVIPRKQRLSHPCSRLDSDLTDVRTCQAPPQVISSSDVIKTDLPYSGRACPEHPLWQQKAALHQLWQQKGNLYSWDIENYRARHISNSFSDLLTKAQRYAISLQKENSLRGPCWAYKIFGLKQISSGAIYQPGKGKPGASQGKEGSGALWGLKENNVSALEVINVWNRQWRKLSNEHNHKGNQSRSPLF